MRRNLYLVLAVAASFMLSACGKLGELSKDNFNVTPEPLEAINGQVPVTINGHFPEKYMKKKATVKVTPILRYEGGESVGQSATFQGEKVEGNNQTISYRIGGNYTMKTSFDYKPAMEKSQLYLAFDAFIGTKAQKVSEVEIAQGVVSTSELYKSTLANANPAICADAYQHVIAQKQEANIKFLIQQAKIRKSELNSTSIEEFVEMLRNIKADQKNFALNNIEVSAYASPDGGLDLNTKLAEKRQSVSTKYLNKELEDIKLETSVDAKYTAEDWDGFKELVSASDIQDKDVILRVLSMYKDPEEREVQIKNISVAFKELAEEVLPALRRARLSINYELIGRSDAEILAQFNEDPSKLSVEELIYGATLTNDVQTQEAIYSAAARLYPNDNRANNNLAVLAYKANNLAKAQSYLAKVPASAKLPEANVNSGLIALAEGNVAEAEKEIAQGTGSKAQNEALGNLYIAQGKYAQAAQYLEGTSTNSEALAKILDKNYEGAQVTLAKVENADAMTSYLKAIVGMRTNQIGTALSNLKEAIAQDKSLAAYAANDLEFAKVFKNPNFVNLVK